jgi:small-conductance mechanosensitive channel
VLIGVTYLIAQVVSSAARRLGDRLEGRRLMLNQGAVFLRFFIYFVGTTLAVFSALKLSDQTLLAVAGTISVALGFALKDLAASVLAGVTILIDRPFQVGDRITFNGVYGEVQSIGLRTVRVVTLDDNLVTIPNAKLGSEIVASGNAGELTMLVQQDFFIAVDQDAAHARRLVGDALCSSRFCKLQMPWTVLVNQVVHEQHFAVRLRAKAYVVDVRYEKAFETDVTLRVMEAFERNGVQPPARLTRMVGGLPTDAAA